MNLESPAIEEDIEVLGTLNKVKIRLNPDFYTLDSIIESLREFEEVCEWKVNEEVSYFTVVMTAKEKLDLKKLAYEFLNHVFAGVKEGF